MWDYNQVMATVYTFVPSANHVYPDHPERPGRLEILEPKLGSVNAERIEAVPAKESEIALVHTPKMIRGVEEACMQGPGLIDYAPTYVTETSYTDALLSAGGVLTCTRAVMNGDAKNAFAIVRPPGHHAEPDRAMGFCIFSNVAIAAKDALAKGLERIIIIDYDVHHGNGTQASLLNEERAGFLSTHQWGIYPGTGWIEDAPHAKKRIVNVPLPAGAGDAAYEQTAERVFKPFIESFRPQMIFISVGFDAHWTDPLAMMGLSLKGYLNLAKIAITLAEEYCNGKIVFVLEGGYGPHAVANGAMGVFEALTGSRVGDEPDDRNPHKEPDCASRIDEVRRHHGFV